MNPLSPRLRVRAGDLRTAVGTTLMKRALAQVGFWTSLIFLVGVLPFVLFRGEFGKDLEVAVPGFVFWMAVFYASRSVLRSAKPGVDSQ